MPSLRLGSLSVWGPQAVDQLKVTCLESGHSHNDGINKKFNNGVLVELGIDVSAYNLTDTCIGAFTRDDDALWGGDRDTSWQMPGRLNLRF